MCSNEYRPQTTVTVCPMHLALASKKPYAPNSPNFIFTQPGLNFY